MPSAIKKAAANKENQQPEKYKRSNREREYNIRDDCILCVGAACSNVIARKALQHRHAWRTIRTTECRQQLLKHAEHRGDVWAKQIIARLLPITDITSADAKYHLSCYLKFYKKGKFRNKLSMTHTLKIRT